MLQGLWVVPESQTRIPDYFSIPENQLDKKTESATRPNYPRSSAAAVLLRSIDLGQNIFRLAHATGADAGHVARYARRLVDNGIWVGGDVIAGWNDPVFGENAFWADVDVALGNACRRLTTDGFLRWAPPGTWWKRFDYDAIPPGNSPVGYEVPTQCERPPMELVVNSSGSGPIGSRYDEVTVRAGWTRSDPDDDGRLGEFERVAFDQYPLEVWLG